MNIYKNGVPLTIIKMIQEGPKNGGLVPITTPVFLDIIQKFWKW